MVEVDWRDHAERGLVDHIGRVITAAEADFENQYIGGHFREGEQGRGRGRLELCDLLPLDRVMGSLQPVDQARIIHDLTGEPDTLVETHEVRTGKDMNAKARCFHHGPHEGAGGPFAVGSGHMYHGRQPVLRPPKQLKRIQDAPER